MMAVIAGGLKGVRTARIRYGQAILQGLSWRAFRLGYLPTILQVLVVRGREGETIDRAGARWSWAPRRQSWEL